jgi:suppressor for copper-sensitivity B
MAREGGFWAGFAAAFSVCAGLLTAVWAAPATVAEDLAPRLTAQPQATAFDPLADIQAALGSPVKVSAVIEPAAGGKPETLAVTARLEEGWHLYSITQKPGGPRPTVIAIDESSSRKIAGGFVPDAAPKVHEAADVPAWKGLQIEEHAGEVTWRAPLQPGSGADVRGTVSLQLCRDNACLPPETLPFAAVRAGAAPAAVPAAGPAPAVVAEGSAAPAEGRTSRPIERSHARVEASFGPARQGPGGPARPLVIELLPEAGWHLYAPKSTATSGVGQGKPTILAVHGVEGGRLAAVTTRDTTMATAAALSATGAVEGPVVLELLVELQPATSIATVDLTVGLQTCSDTTCDPPTGLRIKAAVAAGAAAGTIDIASAKYGEAAENPATIAAATASSTAGVGGGPAVASQGDAAAGQPLSLPLALLMGLAGGLILNLMPCVLPVLGLKLMSFAQQSGRARREVFEMNLWYCAGLFAVFFALATASVAANIGLAGSNLAWGEQFTSASFNLTMLGVVFAFALSFLGIWELPIPGFIGEKAGHVQSQEGPLGSFLKGVLSTVLATPCSGPFLGPVFGFTLTQSTAVTYAVFGAIATGMALPYILVGLAPGLVRFLPRPGGWMATVKEVLGFVMLGTVAYLFTFLGHDWFVPAFVMLIGIWMGCWWVGRAQETQGAVGFGRWVQAAALATAIGTAAFMFLGPTKSLIEWEQPFSRARLAELRAAGATVMVDFSADWCPTCKLNLATAIETNRVKSLIDKNRVVPVLADWTDGSAEIKQMLATLQSKSIPVLAIFPAASPGQPQPPPIVLRDLITEPQVLEALERAGPSQGPATEIRAASAASVPGR